MYVIRRIVCLLALFAILIPAASSSRAAGLAPRLPEDNLRFSRLGLEDGLSQNAALAILQDRQGFIWIGTQDGLNRYDGYNFTVYKHDPNNPATLSHSSILSLYQDRQGFIWVGTWGGGLNRLDPHSGYIQHYRHDDTNPTSLSADTVADILEDRAGRLWIATMGGGLDLLDRSTGNFTHFSALPDDPTRLTSNYVSVIFQDTQNMLWLGTGGFGTEGAGLMRFDPRTGRVTASYRHAPDQISSLSGNTISSIVQDSAGMLWVGTGGFSIGGTGLNRLDPNTGKITRFVHLPNQPETIASNTIMSLTPDSSGMIWMGTWGGGVDRFDPLESQPRFLHTRNDPYSPQSLSADIVWPVLEDRSGVIWFGTVNAGLNLLNPQVQRFRLYRHQPDNPNSVAFDVVGLFYDDPRGGIWVGTWGGGLDLFDPFTRSFTHYAHDPADPNSLPDDTIGGALRARNGTLWFGTFGGLARLDEKTGKFTTYSHREGDPTSLINNSVFTILEDEDNRLWIGTLGGLEVFYQQTGQFTHVRLVPGAQIVKMFRDSRGRFWAGTWEHGVFTIMPETLQGETVTFTHLQHEPNNPNSLASNGVWAIHEANNGDFWFGTQIGLDRLDPSGRFTHYTEANGLPNNTVLCLLADHDGHFWISTNNGLSRFHPQSGEFRNFDVHDGLQSNEFNSGACMADKRGNFYFGGVHGFNVFDPALILDNPTPPPVALTAFQVFNQTQPVDLSGSNPIRLNYQQNFIAFEFTALDFRASQKNRFAYKLEGVDEDWVQAGGRRYASYTNLAGGTYTFRVRAANNDGVWNEDGVTQTIIVEPPIWQTVWFRLLLLFGGLLSFALAGWLRLQSVHSQNRRLEALAAQRTSELRQTNSRLQLEIEQRQKAEEALMARTAEEAVAHERTRLARDLHDAVTQTLFSASLIAEVLPQLWASDPKDAAQSTEELRQLTRGALAEMRTLLLELRPAALTQTRFEDLIKQLTEALIGRARLPIELRVSGTRDLPPDVQVALYRIAQEALNNVAKYAKATHVLVELQMGAGGVRLCIQDDGVGFDTHTVKPTSLGRRIMTERAEGIGAELTVESAPGQGAQVTVLWTPDDL